jgi:hypothetical protein
MDETSYVARKLRVERYENQRGAVIVPVQGVMSLSLRPESNVRLFTNGLRRDIGIGYVAIGRGKRRAAYLQHATPSVLHRGGVRVMPPKLPGLITAQGIIMAQSIHEIPDVSVGDGVPYEAFTDGEHLRPIVDELVAACDNDPRTVAIVPYSGARNLEMDYARTMIVGVEPHRPGLIAADGRVIM